MVDDQTKRTVGIVLFVIGLIFFPFTFISLMFIVFLPVSLILTIIGFAVFYRGLSIRNRGICLIVIGGFFIALSMIIIVNAVPYRDPRVALSVVNILFWVLALIGPGIYKVVEKVDFEEWAVYLYGIAPLTMFWLLIYTIVIAAIEPVAFILMYYGYFLYGFGGSFLLSATIMGFVYLENN